MWVDVATQRNAEKGYPNNNKNANNIRRHNDGDVSDDDLSYITRRIEDRKSHSFFDKSLQEKLLHNGDIPYQRSSCVSLRDKKKKVSKQNRVASAPNIKGSIELREHSNHLTTPSSNVNKVKFLDAPHDEKVNEGIETLSVHSIDKDRISTVSSKSEFSSVASSLFSQTRHGSRKLSKARKYTRLQMLMKGCVALFTVPRGKFMLHCVSFLRVIMIQDLKKNFILNLSSTYIV